MRVLCILVALLLPTVAFSQTTIAGYDVLGLAKYCDTFLKSPKLPAVSVLMRSFGDPLPCLRRRIAMGGITTVQFDLRDATCWRNNACPKGTPRLTDWNDIRKALIFVSTVRIEIKTIVIDTITYAMIGEFMQKAKQTGYAKFTEMGANVYETLKMIDGLRDDLTVIVVAHTDHEQENGVDKSTFCVPGGKLVRDVVKPEGMFTITLETLVEKVGEEVKYYFMVQNNTTNMAKSPAGIFPKDKIDNDINFVLESIRKYEFGETKQEVKVK